MGPFVPALAALGGGSAVAGGITLATTALGAYSAIESMNAGKEAKAETRRAAEREQEAARDEQIERRRALMKSLAIRTAQAGAAGGGTAGSDATLTRTDIRDNRNDLDRLNLNTMRRGRALRQQGNSAYRAGVGNAAVSLLDTTKNLYNSVPRKQ